MDYFLENKIRWKIEQAFKRIYMIYLRIEN